MIEGLIKSMMPPGFDMDGFVNSLASKSQEITAIGKAIERLAESLADQRKAIDLMNAQLLAIIYRMEPDARPVAGWLVENGKTGEKHCSTVDPRGMISGEEIAENQLDISALYKL
jgi:hypothetical protein